MTGLWRLAGALLLALFAVPVSAQTTAQRTIDLKDTMCFAVSPGAPPAARVSRLPYRCTGRPADYQRGWLWLRARSHDIGPVLGEWRLLVDQTRFTSMRLVTVHADGSVRQLIVRSGQAQTNWAPGGFIVFQPDAARPPVTELYLGIERLADFGTMRKVRLVSGPAFDRTQLLWVALMAVFTGIVSGSLVYTAALYAGLRHAFLRQHALWCMAVLTYGLFWSNIAFYAAPWLAGAWGVRLNLLTAGLSALTASLFMVAFLEPGTLSRRLRRAVVAGGWTTFLGSLAASLDFLGPTFAHVSDRFANAAVTAGTLIVIGCLAAAIRHKSRAAIFYALAWSPTLAVLALRSFRNFYLVPHSDWMDMAMFGAIAFQVPLLSAAISDRFHTLQRERDRAEAEKNEFSRLANHDRYQEPARLRGGDRKPDGRPAGSTRLASSARP